MKTVEEILDKKKIYYIPKGKDLLVRCFNPEHDDENPSMRIDREDGNFHCFSCGYKGNLLADLNIETNRFSSKVNKILESITALRATQGVDLPEDSSPYIGVFRDISATTLQKFEAFRSDAKFEGRICFPIKDPVGNIKAIIGRYTHTDVSPKYLIKPKEVALPLYPHPHLVQIQQGTLIMVEGIMDMLNLYDKGLTNTVACFGTSQINKDNIRDKLLPYQILGVDKICILFDGDEAGKKAAKNLESIIQYNTELIVEVLTLSKGKDPGDMTQKEVDNLKNYLQNS